MTKVPATGIGVFLLVSLAGCTLTPDYERPDLDVPEAYHEPASIDPSVANIPWWELFEDDALNALVRASLENNRDLGIAVARVDEARAILGVTRADQFPVVDVQGSGGRFQDSEAVNPLTGGQDFDNFDVTAFASFELDLWGKLRRATEAARADLLATEAAQRNVTISLVANVATTYLLLRDLDDRLAISRRTLKSREDSLGIIQARFDKGVVPALDVAQAEIEAADAQASIAAFQRQVRQTEDALRVLIGANPGPILRGDSLQEQTLDIEVPAGLPIELLQRRPDVFAAEQVLAAETARIGVARAQRFPSLTLTGSFGSQTDEFSDLLDNDTEQWSFFGNLFAPIFNAGQLKNIELAQRARTEQALLNYEQTMLEALREVEDSLISMHTWAIELAARERQLRAARTAAELSRARYDGGVVSYLEVLDSERSLFSTEILESAARQERLNSIVRLYKALGGGWPAQ
jgi:multidrug efflux system outer membrane protein